MTERHNTMNIIEGLAEHASDLAESVGGKHHVEVWAWVKLTPGEPLETKAKCALGETGRETALGFGNNIECAFAKCIEDWQKKGSPTDPEKAELERLTAAAAQLGYSLTPVAKPEPATV